MGRQITEHFNEDELACKCGCGQMEFSDAAVQELERLREEYRRPIRITSGYRCPAHNASVSSTGKTGPHTVTAHDNVSVDVGVAGEKAFEIVALATALGFTGIGVKQKGSYVSRFIHLDRIGCGGRHPRPRLWSY